MCKNQRRHANSILGFSEEDASTCLLHLSSVFDLRWVPSGGSRSQAESPTDSPRAQGDAQVVSIDVDELLNLEYIEAFRRDGLLMLTVESH